MTAPVLSPNTQVNSEGIVNRAFGHVTTDSGTAAIQTFTIGFSPNRIRWVNATDRIELEWLKGMGAASIRTVAAGTRTLDTSSYITASQTQANSGFSFSIAAADIPASKDFYWIAEG